VKRLGHPRDVWVEVESYGVPGPRLLLAVDGRDLEISELQEEYIRDRISIEEFEQRVGEVIGV